MVNYGIAYGLSAYGLAERLNIEQEEAAAYIERYFERFPAVQRYIEETIEAREDGYVTTLLGGDARSPSFARRRPGARLASASRSTCRSRAPRPTSSRSRWSGPPGAGEVELTTRLVLQIHDELLFEGPIGRWRRRASSWSARCAPPSSSTHRLRSTSAVGQDWLSAK